MFRVSTFNNLFYDNSVTNVVGSTSELIEIWDIERYVVEITENDSQR